MMTVLKGGDEFIKDEKVFFKIRNSDNLFYIKY